MPELADWDSVGFYAGLHLGMDSGVSGMVLDYLGSVAESGLEEE